MTTPRVDKPDELVRLRGVTEDLFELFRESFGVPIVVELVLDDVDHGPEDAQSFAASAMVATQLLRRATTSGIPVTNAEVVAIVSMINAAIEHLVHRVDSGCQRPLLRARDSLNEGARVVAELSRRFEGVIVELR